MIMAALALKLGVMAAGADRPAVELRSGPAQVALVELFTSEGCSSCPPAERRLAALRDEPELWRDFVPLAWHVDYWDRLGWRDRFASRASTDREYAYAAAWRSGNVYTPCFVRNGAEARGASMPAMIASGEAAGVLSATYRDGVVRATFAPADARRATAFTDAAHATSASADYELHAAILGGGILSPVKAGENRGETLAHEFVVLRMADGDLASPLPLAVPEVAGVKRHALAVWITQRGALAPVQATGGWLD
jgi:hypothetical protein